MELWSCGFVECWCCIIVYVYSGGCAELYSCGVVDVWTCIVKYV